MKALSLWQPWASAMPFGLKSIETRHWSTDYRGPMAIHAAKRWTAEEKWSARNFASITRDKRFNDLPLGAIIAIGQLVAVVPTKLLRDRGLDDMEEEFGNYADGRFGWMFERIVALPEPISFTGRQGIFNVPDDLLEEITA